MEKVQFLYEHHVLNDNVWEVHLFAESKMQYLHFHMSLSHLTYNRKVENIKLNKVSAKTKKITL